MTIGRLLRGVLADGMARVLFCDTTEMARACANTHEASAVCAAALGRGVSAAALLSASAEAPESDLTLTIKGGGPAGTLVVAAHGRRLKAYINNPAVTLPNRADGKLDVGGALGRDGTITVVRDMGIGEPYIGQCALQSGEVGEDVAYYCAVSEQQPTLCALGVRVHEGEVVSSGGILIQPLPGCPEDVLSALELRAPVYADISAHLLADSLEDLFAMFFKGLEPKILEIEPLAYACDCSRERMARVLLSLGREELTDMITHDDGAEVVCSFCRTKRHFTGDELRDLLVE